MPPIRSQTLRNSAEQESRLLLAIQAIEKQEIATISLAARTFNVPPSTLRRRLSRIQDRASSGANSHKSSEIDERSLQKWNLSMDSREAALRPISVREMADLLPHQRGTTPIVSVGQNWVAHFMKRHPLLSFPSSKMYNHGREKCEDPKIIGEWFNLVQKTILQFGIDPEDIYNFDETAFTIGSTATAKVIARSGYYGRRSLLQPGNREWVTTMECINASGWALPPCVIFKGKVYIESWFDDLPGDWRFEISPNGMTSNEIGLRWLENLFIPSTSSRVKGRYRLLLLDGHASHSNTKFDDICEKHDIIPIRIPPQSSHLLQPLHIGCFAVLKRSYGRFVEKKMRLGFTHIDKLDFLEAYPCARIEAFKSETIKNSFAAAGLVPFSPDRFISELDIRLRTPMPTSSRDSEWEPRTPLNDAQLLKLASSMEVLLRTRSGSSLSPLNRAINQLIKGCLLALQGAVILAKENSDLRAENGKMEPKRARVRRQMPSAEGHSVLEASASIMQPEEAIVAPPPSTNIPGESAIQPRTRPPRGCGICRLPGHRRETCQGR
jgi:hypothetical protein